MSMPRPRATALRLSGSATALTAALGAFCVRNAGLAHEWRTCSFPFGCNYNGNASISPMPTTSVTLPGGSSLAFGLYAALVLACGLLIAAAAAQLTRHPRRVGRLTLCAASLLLSLSPLVFRLPPPTGLLSSPCPPSPCPTQVIAYPNAIPSVVYLVPAVALGLLAAVVGLFPARPGNVLDNLPDNPA
jgi:hypothetical protein